MSREIVKFGAHVLRERCEPVAEVNGTTRRLVQDLFESMHAAEGVGLAAPQLGEPVRVIVVDVSRQEPQNPPVALINPEIIQCVGTQIREEGCLSFPDLYGEVKRAEQVHIRALDQRGAQIEIVATEFLARALQHEIDHLDGKLFIDLLNPLKRQLMRGNLKRLKRVGEAWDMEREAATR
jgi:peptide deformylase